MTPQEYREKLGHYKINRDSIKEEAVQGFLPLLQQLDAVEGSSAILFDMALMDYRFLTRQFRFLLGPGQDKIPDMAYFLQKMNSEDRNLFFDTSLASFRYLSTLPPQEKTLYRTCQDFRIQREDSKWIRMIQQMIVLSLNAKEDIWLVLIVNDDSPFHDMNIPGRRFMEYIPTGERVLFKPEEAHAPLILTRREVEILGLIARGFPSRDIADYLGISVSTINNHRQHILKKTETANSSEALERAHSLGLLKSL